MALTKDQIVKHFELVLGSPICPFCHQHDFELVLDKNGDIAYFSTVEGKPCDAPLADHCEKGAKCPPLHYYIAARCKVCNWVAYFDYEEIKKAIEAKAK